MEIATNITGLAFVMDIREKNFHSLYADIFTSLKEKGYTLDIIFLEAEEESLIKRFSQTRRQHPLSHHKNLIEGIKEEKQRLQNLREAADVIIDTTRYNVHELRAYVLELAEKTVKTALMKINILSFGFKNGIPNDADLIIDVRFLANPYFVPELKDLDGQDKKVSDFVLNNDKTILFLEKYTDLLDYLIPLYVKEGKAYLTIAVGCTGGRHRSVAIAQKLYKHVKKSNKFVAMSHRDISQ